LRWIFPARNYVLLDHRTYFFSHPHLLHTIGEGLGFFFLYSILGIIFGAFNIVLVSPMLQVLFDRTQKVTVAPGVAGF